MEKILKQYCNPKGSPLLYNVDINLHMLILGESLTSFVLYFSQTFLFEGLCIITSVLSYGPKAKKSQMDYTAYLTFACFPKSMQLLDNTS